MIVGAKNVRGRDSRNSWLVETMMLGDECLLGIVYNTNVGESAKVDAQRQCR
jgi:hypothetical protein